MPKTPAPISSERDVEAFLKQRREQLQALGRLLVALDATASRKGTWDTAAKLQADMLDEAAKIGTLQIQVACYHGRREFQHSDWSTNGYVLTEWMSKIECRAGETQIVRTLEHIRTQKPISAAVFVGDAMEEDPRTLYNRAAGLGAPLFLFQEGADETVEKVFRELARLTNGAWHRFDQGSAAQLSELLRAVAQFAAGGRAALTANKSATAVALLQQLK